MRALFLAAAVLLAAVPAFGTEPLSGIDDPAASIEVGRYGVMLDQIVAAKELFAAHDIPIAAQDAPRGSIYEILDATVLRFNTLSGQVCRDIELPAADCTDPFKPAWLSAPPSDQPHLRAMIDEAGFRVTTFWGDVCAKARSAKGDEHLCDIE